MEKQKCAGTAYHAGRSYNCGRTGTLEHDGKMWCKTHHPPTRKEKAEKQWSKWEAEAQMRREKSRQNNIKSDLCDKALAWMREAYPACVAAWEAELEEARRREYLGAAVSMGYTHYLPEPEPPAREVENG